jgi:DNA (cytosine-5)-methyltransferase 1
MSLSNHFTPSLSSLDMEMICHVPPGGNWKNIPSTVLSERLKQIRRSFEAGEGSRSTYYGRLHPHKPSYTINTYFNRPGNGCFVHYAEDRMISQREAARLQSFPDHFLFVGSRGAVNKQIGNAVPPALAYHIAECLPNKGVFIDLFCGAGGLALGFEWSGWRGILANDKDASALQTYERNLHAETIPGDIQQDAIFREVVEKGRQGFHAAGRTPTFVLGGPPCQGFSTAGKRRSMDDDRNNLFIPYAALLKELKPDGFVFENVPGLLNMEGGEVYKLIKEVLRVSGYFVTTWILQSELFGIPQRRKRVFMVGLREDQQVLPPAPTTSFEEKSGLFEKLPPTVTSKEALDDLPSLKPGQDGSDLEYESEPTNVYQRLLRGQITAREYVSSLSLQRSAAS